MFEKESCKSTPEKPICKLDMKCMQIWRRQTIWIFLNEIYITGDWQIEKVKFQFELYKVTYCDSIIMFIEQKAAKRMSCFVDIWFNFRKLNLPRYKLSRILDCRQHFNSPNMSREMCRGDKRGKM